MNGNGINPPKKIVDIGCGKGRNTIYMAILLISSK